MANHEKGGTTSHENLMPNLGAILFVPQEKS
jgi:hypothetical protein